MYQFSVETNPLYCFSYIGEIVFMNTMIMYFIFHWTMCQPDRTYGIPHAETALQVAAPRICCHYVTSSDDMFIAWFVSHIHFGAVIVLEQFLIHLEQNFILCMCLFITVTLLLSGHCTVKWNSLETICHRHLAQDFTSVKSQNNFIIVSLIRAWLCGAW